MGKPKYTRKDYEQIAEDGIQGIILASAGDAKKVEYKDDTGQTYKDVIKIGKKKQDRKMSKKERKEAQKELATLVSAPM